VQGSAQGFDEKGGLESFEGAFLKQLPATAQFLPEPPNTPYSINCANLVKKKMQRTPKGLLHFSPSKNDKIVFLYKQHNINVNYLAWPRKIVVA
jgi:hypothetical protein